MLKLLIKLLTLYINNFKIKIILISLFKDIKNRLSPFKKSISYSKKINYHKKVILFKNIQIHKKAQIMQ